MAYMSGSGGGGGGLDLSDIPQANASGVGLASGTALGGDSLAWPIYIGDSHHREYDARQGKVANELGEVPYTGYTTSSPRTLNVAALLDRFDHFDHKQFLSWRDRLAIAGYSVGSGSPLEVRSAYQSMLEDVYQRQASIVDGGMGRRNLTPVKYLNELIRMSGGDPGSLGGVGGSTGVKKRSKTTSISKSIYELDPGEARTIMTKTLQQYLGRDPSKGEVADFVDAVNSQAEDDPTVKSTTTKYVKRDDGSLKRVSSTSDTEDTGYTSDDAMWEAIDKAKASPDYGEYQAVSTYFPVIEGLLGASVAGI